MLAMSRLGLLRKGVEIRPCVARRAGPAMERAIEREWKAVQRGMSVRPGPIRGGRRAALCGSLLLHRLPEGLWFRLRPLHGLCERRRAFQRTHAAVRN